MEKQLARTPQETKGKSLVSARGRIFQGKITKKFPTRAVIEFERTSYVSKYERYQKKKTKLHARIPEGINVEIGDLVRIQETRPLSKIIHFIIIEITKKVGENKS